MSMDSSDVAVPPRDWHDLRDRGSAIWLPGMSEYERQRKPVGRVYPNFPDPALADPERAYYGPNLDRLRRIKADYDPIGLFPSAAGGASILVRDVAGIEHG